MSRNSAIYLVSFCAVCKRKRTVDKVTRWQHFPGVQVGLGLSQTLANPRAGMASKPPPTERNTKIPQFDRNNTYRSSDKGGYL